MAKTKSQIGRMSKRKGASGERELAGILRDLWGVEARRGQQFCGSNGDPDVVTSIEKIHIEVKRTETLSLYKAMDQAKSDSKGRIPLLMHRRNGQPWLCVLELDKVLEFVKIMEGVGNEKIDNPSDAV